MTTQETYTIGDAAKKVKVEAHVLRYWEEELGLPINRNELGHRYYTTEDMVLLGNVKKWKDQGLQLKAIRLMLSGDGRLSVPQEVVRQAQAMVEKAFEKAKAAEDMKDVDGDGDLPAQEEGPKQALQQENEKAEEVDLISALTEEKQELSAKEGEEMSDILFDERSSKAARLQFLLENLVSRAVAENNQAILKELDFQFRQFEDNAQAREQKHWEREEEHFRKLDELLCQRGRRNNKRKKHSKF